MSNKYQDELNKLLNKPISDIGRACNMLWLCFGTEIEDDAGRIVNEFAIHVHCPWRFISEATIVLGSGDIYLPKDELIDLPDFDFLNFDYDIVGNNRFDQIKNDILLELKKRNVCIKQIYVHNISELVIVFDNGWEFHTFSNVSKQGEVWRLLDNRTDTCLQTVICY